MGCCQHAPKGENGEITTNNGLNEPEKSVSQEILDQFFYKEKYFQMILDKLELDLDIMINRYNSNEAISFYERKTLFQSYLKKIQENINILNEALKKKKKINEKNMEEMSELLNDMQVCSEINYNFNDWKNLSEEEKNTILQEFEKYLQKYLKHKPGELEKLFKTYEKQIKEKKQDSPLKKYGK